MGKHNGKTRKTGLRVGTALVSRKKQGITAASAGQLKHTTEMHGPGQSILERSDLDELMAMADLADRDFTADREQQFVVFNTGAVDAKDEERERARRQEAEEQLGPRLKIPRRPSWTHQTTPEQLDAQERNMFLEWRRGLAAVEEEERLLLTPFERNLDVWRQLWRVVERSDIVCQVVDARDPLLYWSQDLVDYCHEMSRHKASYMLLNKADLLPPHVRAQWADFLDSMGVEYVFWSAIAVMEAQKAAKAAVSLGLEAPVKQLDAEELADPRIRLLDAEQLLQWVEERAAKAYQAMQESDSDSESGDEEAGGAAGRRPAGPDGPRRVMVGLVGYPNVGKSTSINALFGTKKAAMGPTPGKTKHFQTLIVSPTVCLCDCPGLVFPRFAASKAEMVAAGVISIDRLTEMRPPCEVAAARCGRVQLEQVYGIRIKAPKPGDPPHAPPSAGDVLAAIGLARGWTSTGGLPDETRSGRQMLKDYTAGKLLYCALPPGSPLAGWIPGPEQSPAALMAAQAAVVRVQVAAELAAEEEEGSEGDEEEDEDEEEEEDEDEEESGSEEEEQEGEEEETSTSHDAARAGEASSSGHAAASSSSAPLSAGAAAAAGAGAELGDEADLLLLETLEAGSAKSKKVRAEHKFHKKAARTKGTRGLWRDGGGYDGAAMATGKKGGLVRVGGY